MNDELPVKYLLGEAGPEERAQVEQWLAESEANRKHLEQLQYIWTESKKLESNSKIDEAAAWQKFKQKIESRDNTHKRIPMTGRMIWLRVAAILIMVIGGGYLSYIYILGGDRIILESEDMVLSETLPDGTQITLNKYASIRYPKKFTGNTREIILEGEAFFNVSPDKQKPFIIHANEAEIQVVGTSFNVKSRKNETEVIVETGVVEVSKDRHGVTLKPREKAIVRQNSSSPVKEKNEDELYNYYRTKEFTCNNTPMSRLIPILNEAYGVHIVIANNKIHNERLTATFRNDSLDNILHVLEETFNISIQKNKDQIILK